MQIAFDVHLKGTVRYINNTFHGVLIKVKKS